MRPARLILALLVAVIALGIAAVALLPSVTDWNRYRATLEVLAGEALGRPVSIAGPVSLSLLPEPVLTASRVSVGGGGGAHITIRELRLGVALLPLLTGQVDARSLTLQQPDFHLPWPPWRGVALAAPPWPAELSARIQGGRIEAGGVVLTNVDATLLAGRGDAALTLTGSATEGKSTWNLSLRMGEPQVNGTVPLEATLQGRGQAQGAAARLSGALSAGGGLAGHLVLDGPHLSELITAPPLPFHADGRFTLEPGAIRLAGLSVALGSVAAHGSGTLTLEPGVRLDLALATQQTIPLDPWLGMLRGGGVSRWPVGLSFTAPRATLARGLLQNLSLAMVLGPGGAEIGAFRAVLPGNAAFAAEGHLTPAAAAAGKWQFAGTVHLAAPSLIGTLHWLNAAAPGVLPPLPAGVLGEAAIGGRIVVGENAVALSHLSGTIDRSKISGGLSLGLGGHPAISAGLQVERLNLDPWLPPWWREVSSRRFFALAKVPAMFRGMSIELELTAGVAIFGRTTISGLSLDAAAGPGQVILRRLDATIDGVHAIASGTIGKSGEVTEGRLTLNATRPAALVGFLPAPLRAAIGRWQAGFALDARAAGPPQALRITINANLGDVRLTAAPTVNLNNAAWHGPVSLRHPGAAELIAASGLPNPLPWLGPGSLSLIGEAAGDAHGWSLGEFRLIAGALHASGHLEDLGGSEITGSVHARRLPVPLPGSAAAGLLRGLIESGNAMVGLSATEVMAGQRVVLKDATGGLMVSEPNAVLEVNGNLPGGGALAAVLRVTAGSGPPRFRLGTAFSGVLLKGGLIAGVPDIRSATLDGHAALAAEGYGPAALLATLGGTVRLTLHDGVLSGLNLAGVRSALSGKGDVKDVAKALGKALSGGQTEFSRLGVTAQGSAGQFRLQRVTMVGPDGVIEADGTLDLPAESEALRLAIRPALSGAPDLLLRLGGPMAAPKRVEEISAALQWNGRQEKAR
ncbi:MAG: AsmA family protein [Acetobacteraceae bacterium]